MQPASTSRCGKAAIVIPVVIAAGIAAFVWQQRKPDAPDEPKTLTVDDIYRTDSRIRFLVADCGFTQTFDADTSNIVAILTSKLDRGAQREPLRRATADLAQMGDRAEEELGRLFRKTVGDRELVPIAKNVLGVCALSTDDFGVELAKIGLGSPVESIRRESAIVMSRHPSPELYGILTQALPGLRSSATVTHALKALWLSDREQFSIDLGTWIKEAEPNVTEIISKEGRLDAPQIIVSDLVTSAATIVADAESKTIADRLVQYEANSRGLDMMLRMMLLAPSARLGDEAVRQRMRDLLSSDKQLDRQAAAEGLARAQLGHELYILAAVTDDPLERASAWSIIFNEEATAATTDEQRAQMLDLALEALGDDDPQVRDAALKGLIMHGDERGQVALMGLLAGSPNERSRATHVMRDEMGVDPVFAASARDLLEREWRKEMDGSRVVHVLKSIVSALGAIPGEKTARLLLAMSDELDAADAADGSSDLMQKNLNHHHFIGEMYNAGPEARDVILEQLSTEEDPLDRIDLINLAWQDREEDSFVVLAGILQDDTRSPYERLFVADRLTRIGMPERVAPLLKRVYRSTSDPVLRPGLQCILWPWYGPRAGSS